MSAIRVARGFTGRDTIVKCEGCYHGHEDSLLVKAGSGATTFGVPTSPGVPADVVRHTLTVPYNDLARPRRGAPKPIPAESPASSWSRCPATWGASCPSRATSRGCARSPTREGIVLIFDEVMSGFRRGAGRRAGALRRHPRHDHARQDHRRRASRRGLRRQNARSWRRSPPAGPVYQAGTLSGNPLAMTGGHRDPEGTEKAGRLRGARTKIPTIGRRPGRGGGASFRSGCISPAWASMFTTFFTEGPVYDYTDRAQERHGALRRIISWACSTAASTWPPASSRPDS